MPEREWEFTLTLQPPADIRTLADPLFEAGCDDATLSERGGRVYLAFCRDAATYRSAVLGALADTQKAGCRVARLNAGGLVTRADIARLTERSPRVIREYVAGARGPGGFPAPEFRGADDKEFWRWPEVADWLREHDMLDAERHERALVDAVVNNLLEADALSRRRRRAFDLERELAEFAAS